MNFSRFFFFPRSFSFGAVVGHCLVTREQFPQWKQSVTPSDQDKSDGENKLSSATLPSDEENCNFKEVHRRQGCGACLSLTNVIGKGNLVFTAGSLKRLKGLLWRNHTLETYIHHGLVGFLSKIKTHFKMQFKACNKLVIWDLRFEIENRISFAVIMWSKQVGVFNGEISPRPELVNSKPYCHTSLTACH